MTRFTVQAVYRKGALQPKEKLDLPEEALVQVQVTPLTSPAAGFAALKGIWSHLSGKEVEKAAKDLELARQYSDEKIRQLADALTEEKED